jgi:hypothetical protein
MDKDLRRFAIADPKFPMYSTLRQFLSPLQFGNLVRIGQFAGRKMTSLEDDVPGEVLPANPTTPSATATTEQ